ncbi:MAG: PepSY domain-containing protein [Pseudomonadota bacterium]
MRTAHHRIGLFSAALLALLFALPVTADDEDHERARQALEAGEILPLRTVLDRVAQDYPGEVLEIELEREDGRWVYEIKLLREGGSLLKMELDARDATLLKVKGRDTAPAARHGERR